MAAYWEIAAHSAYDMFYINKYLIVNLDFSHIGYWRGKFFLIALFPDFLPSCIFLIFAQNIDCGYKLEPNKYQQSIFWNKNKKTR